MRTRQGGTDGVTYARFTVRAAGSLADAGILQIVSLLIRTATIVWLAGGIDLNDELARYAAGQGSAPTGRLLLVIGAWGAMSLLFNMLYFSLQEGSRRSATVGKRLVRIRVVDAATFQPISPARAALRTAAKLVSLAPLGLGYLWMLWDRRRQCWHDKLSGTVVIVDRNDTTTAAS